jgi:RHS repeat-associated protein
VNAIPPPDKVPETTYYMYDAGGQRVCKVTERQNGSRKAERIYVGGFEIYREFDGNGIDLALERETLHIMDDKQRIALVETRTQGSDGSPPQLIRYQFGNHLGSASLELDDKASVISYEEYTPYGSTSYQAVDQGIKAAAKRYRYTGKERDEETGFSYHGARYYAPWLGRWVSCDPSGLSGGLNLYQYAGACPTYFVDPSGLNPQHPEDTDIHQFWREGPPAQNTGTDKPATMSGPPPSGGLPSSQPENGEDSDDHDEDPTRKGEPRRRDDKQLTGIQKEQQRRRQQKDLTPREDLVGAHDPNEWEDQPKPKERSLEGTDKSVQDAKKRRQPGATRRKETLPQADVRTAPHNQPKPVPPQRPTPLKPPKQDVPKPDPAPLPPSTPPEPTPVPQQPALPHPAEPRTPSGLTPEQLRRLQDADKPLEQGALDWAAMLTLGFVVSRALVPPLLLRAAGSTGAATAGGETFIPALIP